MMKFLLAESPIEGGTTAIIHTAEAPAIIELSETHQHAKHQYRNYAFENVDGTIEPCKLKIHHSFVKEFDSEKHALIVDSFLDEAWEWYVEYMDW